MHRHHALPLLTLALSLVANHAYAACTLGQLAELPVTMRGLRPVISARIDGIATPLVVDSGAFYSMLTPAGAAELRLSVIPAPYNLQVVGIAGGADVSVTTVRSLMFAGLRIANVQFMVGGSDVGGGADGYVGQNLLHFADVEYDLGHGAIRLMHPTTGCQGVMLAYWAGSQPYSVMSINTTSPLSPQTVGTAYLNGTRIRVVFDTGAPISVLTLGAAERAGFKAGATGVVTAGYLHGIGPGRARSWIARFASFRIGQEQIRNARLRVGDFSLGNLDMLLGADFFLSHRIYVATSQHQLYFTYNGGTVFDLSSPSISTATTAHGAAAAPGIATAAGVAAAHGAAATPATVVQRSAPADRVAR